MADYKVRDIRITFTFFSGVFSLLAYKHYPSPLSYIFILFISALLFLVIFAPLMLAPLFNKWIKLSLILGKINTKILLMLIFVVIFIPTGLLRRFFGKDPMQRQFRCGETYWEPYELAGLKDKSRYEKQF